MPRRMRRFRNCILKGQGNALLYPDPYMRTPGDITPSYMFFPVHNHRMQKWFEEVMDLQCSNRVTLPDGYGEITVPTTSFNVIYTLSHLYRHVFTEGIGLRQLLDYYFVLMKWHTDLTDSTDLNLPYTQLMQEV